MQKIYKYFAPAVAAGVMIFIIFFLISINSDDGFVETQALSLDTNVSDIKPEKTWLNHFSKTQRKGYSYPVNEVYVKVDLNEKITKIITYKLTAKLHDPYQLFCLKEELKNHNLQYFLQKENAGVILFIYSQDVDKLNNLVKVLKKYKISAKIKLYKEEY